MDKEILLDIITTISENISNTCTYTSTVPAPLPDSPAQVIPDTYILPSSKSDSNLSDQKLVKKNWYCLMNITNS